MAFPSVGWVLWIDWRKIADKEKGGVAPLFVNTMFLILGSE